MGWQPQAKRFHTGRNVFKRTSIHRLSVEECKVDLGVCSTKLKVLGRMITMGNNLVSNYFLRSCVDSWISPPYFHKYSNNPNITRGVLLRVIIDNLPKVFSVM